MFVLTLGRFDGAGGKETSIQTKNGTWKQLIPLLGNGLQRMKGDDIEALDPLNSIDVDCQLAAVDEPQINLLAIFMQVYFIFIISLFSFSNSEIRFYANY